MSTITEKTAAKIRERKIVERGEQAHVFTYRTRGGTYMVASDGAQSDSRLPRDLYAVIPDDQVIQVWPLANPVFADELRAVFAPVEPATPAEPTPLRYAAFGRYVAALLGSHKEWPGSEMLEWIAEAATTTLHAQIGEHDALTLASWRIIADELGIEHDGEEEETEEQE